VFRVTDLKAVTVVTDDLDVAVATFRKNFGFPLVRSAETAAGRSAALGIGAAEIEMSMPAGAASPLAAFLAERGPGLQSLVLEVDDLDAACADLAARGIEASIKRTPEGTAAAHLSPTQTHGVRITLVAR
jgi:methylmalonyl-CoA/ethylmalonyl-CoA epimerase